MSEPIVRTGDLVRRIQEHAETDAIALVDAATGRTVPYAELLASVRSRVESLRSALGHDRRALVVLSVANRIESIEWYLACLADRHPVVLVDEEQPATIETFAATYGAAAVIHDGRIAVRDTSAVELHPELALLLSTSGSTGSPKLVRLSQRNLVANAESIAEYLELTADDVALTTLPMHYCYGLSVLHSHLLVGATVVVSDVSVVDPSFWTRVDDHRVTGIAGVPHTFELLAATGLAEREPSSLRYLTQAGGRMDPERVRTVAAAGRRQGWDLFVMYGQTEATARMAYLPPDRLLEAPSSIGRPIPGGEFVLRDDDGSAIEAAGVVGELEFRGPNVMMGYATSPGDLAGGPELEALLTGDLARRRTDGLFEIVGRRSRFLKLFGLRVDLDQLERRAAAAGLEVHCTGDDERLVVGHADADAAAVAPWIADAVELPAHAVRLVGYDEVPRLANGKIDHQLLRRRAADDAAPIDAGTSDATGPVAALYARVLGRPEVDSSASFVDLGGDSLSYIEVSIELEDLVGELPSDWHLRPVAGLEQLATPDVGRSLLRWVDTDIALRALSITAVVASHFGWFDLKGGAHVLLAAVGFNLARFQLPALARSESVSGLVSAASRLVVPTLVWTTLVALVADVGWANYLLVTNHVPDAVGDTKYWFIEVVVQLLAVLALVLAVGPVRRRVVADPIAAGWGLLAVGLALRHGLHRYWDAADYDFKIPTMLLWLVALGWLASVADDRTHRLAASVAVIAAVPGFFDSPSRSLVIMAGILALVWIPRVPVPRLVHPALVAVAGASMYVYLTHFQATFWMADAPAPLRTAAALAFGVVFSWFAQRAMSEGERLVRR